MVKRKKFDGHCKPRTCQKDSECPMLLRCEKRIRRCIPIQCYVHGECGGIGFKCHNRKCVYTPPCKSRNDCKDPETICHKISRYSQLTSLPLRNKI